METSTDSDTVEAGARPKIYRKSRDYRLRREHAGADHHRYEQRSDENGLT